MQNSTQQGLGCLLIALGLPAMLLSGPCTAIGVTYQEIQFTAIFLTIFLAGFFVTKLGFKLYRKSKSKSSEEGQQ